MPNNFNLGTAIGMWYEIHKKMKKIYSSKNFEIDFQRQIGRDQRIGKAKYYTK